MSKEQEAEQEKLLRDIHLAVCGNENLGVPGLVHRVDKLEKWKRWVDLRVAGILGGLVVLGYVGKLMFPNLFK